MQLVHSKTGRFFSGEDLVQKTGTELKTDGYNNLASHHKLERFTCTLRLHEKLPDLCLRFMWLLQNELYIILVL